MTPHPQDAPLSDVDRAMRRIESGWRIGYHLNRGFYVGGWFVYHPGMKCGGPYMKRDEVLATYKRVTDQAIAGTAASAEYLRLTEGAGG